MLWHFIKSLSDIRLLRKRRVLPLDDIQQQGNQFRLLLAYLDAVRKAHHVHVHLQTGIHEGVQRFRGLFICPEVSAESFRHFGIFSQPTEPLRRRSATSRPLWLLLLMLILMPFWWLGPLWRGSWRTRGITSSVSNIL
jgi:hypothetical protein